MAPNSRLSPWHRRFDGAVLLADIAGFTPLTEAMAVRGSAGAEQLSHLLNECFGRIADQIAEYGGDVVGFAGDAPIAVFEDLHEQPSGSAIERAAACAHALQDALPESDSHPMAIRVAVASGALVELGAGGVADSWHWLVGGQPLDIIGRALRSADAGQVAIAQGSDCAIASSPANLICRDDWRLVRTGSPAEACRRFVPAGVVSRLDEGQSAWVAELRKVTTMFATIRGYDFGRRDILEQIQTIVEGLQASVFSTDGSIIQLIADDKGTTLVGGWGLPGHAHDDDPERAALAAVAVRSVLNDAGVTFGIGLATGRAFCGWRGNDRRREYALIGATVNLAARLAAAANGNVLTDDATRDGAAARLSFEAAGAAHVKGRAGAVATFRCVAERTLTTSPANSGTARAHVIGQADQLRRLAEAVDAAVVGRGGVVFLRGEAGTGKSLLAAEAIERAKRANIRVLFGAGTPVERAAGYDGWRDILHDLLDLAPGATAQARVLAVHRLLAEHHNLTDLAPLLGPVLEVRMEETPLTARMSAQVRADGVRTILFSLIEAELAKGPLLLVLDDGHALGSLSWGAIASVVRRLPGLLVVCALRPMADPPVEWPELIARSGSSVLDITRLSDDEAAELACRELGLDRLPTALQRLVRDKAAGNPLFVIEFVRWMCDTQAITVEGGRCRFKDGGDILPAELPGSVEGVVLGRLNQLPATHQLTLRIASVVGRSFSIDTLRALHPVERDTDGLRAEIELCGRLGFLEVSSTSVAFCHELVRDVTYQLMPPTQRTGLHRKVADLYERLVDTEQYDAELAYHREGAKQYPEALEHLARAGEHAWAEGGSQETLGFFTRALELANREQMDVESVRRARWHRLSAQAHVALGDVASSRQHLHSALELLDARFPITPRAVRRRLILDAGRQMLHIVFPRRRLRPPSKEEQIRVTEIVRTLKSMSDVAFLDADHLLYMTTSLSSINHAESAGVGSEAKVGYASAAYTASLLKMEPLARRWWRLGERSAGTDAGMTLLLARSLSALQRARWDEFESLVDELVSTAETLGDAHHLEAGLVVQILGRYHQGQLEASLAAARALLDSSIARANEQHQLWALQAISSILHLKGDSRGGMKLTREAVLLLPSISDQLTVTQHYGHRLELANLAGDLDAASELAAEVAKRIETVPPTSVGTLGPFLELTRYSVEAWARGVDSGRLEVAELARKARWACRQLARYAFFFPFARPYHLVLQGRIHWLAGRRRRAARVWLRAERQARKLGLPVAEAEAVLCLGRYASADTLAGAAYLARSNAAFRRLGFVVVADAD